MASPVSLKNVFIFLTIVIVVFVILLYWSLSSTDKTFQKSELINIENADKIKFKDYDSVLVAASSLYEADVIKTVMQGEQYRKEWSTPIKVPVLFLDTLFGGVTILDEGGGKQTHSLKLKAINGTIYTLRSINKDPEPLIPDFASTLGLENIIVDGISAQHPYGALYAAKLSEAAHILHTNPKVVFLPKQKLLDAFNTKFGNRLFLLEYETEGAINWTNLKHVINLIDTDKLQELKQDLSDSLIIDKSALIRARLFDFLIGDWDRHTKQWGWAIQKENSTYKAIPIAGDRDNAFFDTDGFIPSILTNEHVVPELRPFEDDIDFIEGLVYPFDRYFLVHTSEELFTTEAKALQNLLTDEVIDNALDIWPKAIKNLGGDEIARKIKSRRNDILIYAQRFKSEIDKQGVLSEPLKGSKDLILDSNLSQCFDCKF